jgi:hypothetical protein
VEIALAKGKKKYDKRNALKEKELKRDMEQARKKGTIDFLLMVVIFDSVVEKYRF